MEEPKGSSMEQDSGERNETHQRELGNNSQVQCNVAFHMGKPLGKCFQAEIEREIERKQSLPWQYLNPHKELGNCSVQELEEQLKIVKDRDAACLAGNAYPSPEKKIGDCTIQELEIQLQKLMGEVGAASKIFQLAKIPEATFLEPIVAFLEDYDMVAVMQVQEINSLYQLDDKYCKAHGNQLIVLKRKAEDDITVSSSGTSIAATFYNYLDIDEENDFKEWQSKNPSPNPTKCYGCHQASQALEPCPLCHSYRKWYSFFECDKCHQRLCQEQCGTEVCFFCRG